MHRKKLYVLLVAAGTLVIVACGIALATPRPVKAQCGSQASSCKNCHEVQGKKPVNSDGTGWHQSHAFGDFCYICHGGNSQATDQTAAHTGMVSPLSDVKAACAQCHPNDLQARAEVYAKKLGVQVGTSASSPAAPGAASSATATPAAAPAMSEPPAPASGNANIVDYVQRYDENALGQFPTNWGNVVLWIMIVAMVVGGGGLIATREGLVRVSFKETKPVAGEYPTDVVDMVPDIAKLKPGARQSLRRMLKKTGPTGELLDAVDRLSHDEQD
ncbi:MAG TPA: hypothetical protein VF784_05045 [Anaerolineales bacterium]